MVVGKALQGFSTAHFPQILWLKDTIIILSYYISNIYLLLLRAGRG